MNRIPKWCWWIIGAVIVLALFWLVKLDIHMGPSGFSISQGLFR